MFPELKLLPHREKFVTKLNAQMRTIKKEGILLTKIPGTKKV